MIIISSIHNVHAEWTAIPKQLLHKHARRKQMRNVVKTRKYKIFIMSENNRNLRPSLIIQWQFYKYTKIMPIQNGILHTA